MQQYDGKLTCSSFMFCHKVLKINGVDHFISVQVVRVVSCLVNSGVRQCPQEPAS